MRFAVVQLSAGNIILPSGAIMPRHINCLSLIQGSASWAAETRPKWLLRTAILGIQKREFGWTGSNLRRSTTECGVRLCITIACPGVMRSKCEGTSTSS
eukprot:COSAG02_NODE_970_length_15551_cov_4.985698_8_plen_99_part_00